MIIDFNCNNTNFNKLYVSNKGGSSIIIALSNNKDIPTILCKMFKYHKLEFVVFNNIDKSTYDKLIKDNIISKLICIQTINTPNNNFSYEYSYKNIKTYEKFYNKLYYYEISGICTLKDIIDLWVLNNYKNPDFIIDLINIFMKKSDIFTSKYNLIHRDAHLNNFMFKNKYTLYLFDIFYKFRLSNPNSKDYKKYLKILKRYIFKNKTEEKYNDETLIKKYNIDTFTPSDKNYDILFIDLDNTTNIVNNILKFTNKYNKKNKKIQDIITLLISILIYIDKIYFLRDLIIILSKNYSNYLINKYDNLYKVFNYCCKLYNNIVNDIINKSNILQNINNKIVILNLIWEISRYFIHGSHNNITQNIIDTVINYLYHNYYDLQISNIDTFYDIYFYFISIDNYDLIPYTDEEKKEIFV